MWLQIVFFWRADRYIWLIVKPTSCLLTENLPVSIGPQDGLCQDPRSKVKVDMTIRGSEKQG